MMNKGEKKRIIWITLVLIGILFMAAAIRIYDELLASNVRTEAHGKFLYCYTGLDFSEQCERIRNQKILRHPDALFRILSLSGYDVMIKPGRYKLSEDQSNIDLIRLLVSGRQEPFDLVFKQADRIHDAASFFGQQLEADSNQIEALLLSSLPYDSLQLDAASAIMLFIPDTYNFYWNTSAEKLVAKMVRAYRNFWDSARLTKAAALSLSIQQVGTLASIVQKETYRGDEMPVVAGVYFNRLKKGMPLQADPTILFALNDRSIRRVAGAMLKINSPYNTYINLGLPPGPICMPNQQSIDAVLNLANHRYLYFCAREDFSGYHRFAETFEKHQLNARKYQRALNSKGIK